MKVLVLGHKGMLGHMVTRYLRDNKVEVVTSDARWPESPFKSDMKLDYVINCIGAIPQRTKSFDINWHLPIWLDFNSPCRVIHPGTDCEMDDDFYGVSKKIASDYLVNHGVNTKIIKTSIIGHELESADSLLDWFLTTEGTVSGYTKAMWNGNTTLEWAKFCDELMLMWDSQEIENVIQSDCISKYDLLMKMKDIYGGNVTKIRKNNKSMPNKCLTDGIQKNPIEIQLKELKEFYGY